MVWRQFMYNWLRRETGRHVADAVSAAKADVQRKASAEDPASVTPRLCHVGIVVSDKTERGSIVDRLSGVVETQGNGFGLYEGQWRSRRIAVVEVGGGLECIAAATRALLAGHTPEWVVAAGFAGALVPALQRGDLVVADSVGDESGRRLKIDIQTGDDPDNQKYTIGGIVSVSQQPTNPQAKRALAAHTHAEAVDTSSLAVAEVCRESRVLCLVVRVVRDALEDSLPDEMKHMHNQKSLAGRLGAATGALMKRPSTAKDWWNIKQESLRCADHLALFLEEIVQQLIPSSRLEIPTRETSEPPDSKGS